MSLEIITDFDGDYSKEIYKDLAVGNEVVEKGIAFLELDVPQKRALRYAKQSDNPIGGWIATPLPGDVTVSSEFNFRELDLVKSMIYERFSPVDYDLVEEDLRSVGSQTEHRVAPKVLSEVMQLLVPNAGAQMSHTFFHGVTSNTGEFDGIFTEAIADGNTIQVTPAGLININNVIDIISSVIDSIPDKDYLNEDYKIMMSVADYRILQRYNTLTKKSHDGVLEDTFKNMMENKQIIPLVGIDKNHILCTKTGNTAESNLHFGFWFDEKNEFADARVNRVANDSEEWFLRVNFKMDANYKYSENLIYYIPE
ncbi:MAG: hypothetical protein DRI95_00575 [Bacteroidetes bacterium]|nr:MAG: hypothetical protein DRI95_00575 [Bacteroidota bacterium]